MKRFCIVTLMCLSGFASKGQTFSVEVDSTTWFGMSYTFVGQVTNQSSNNIIFGLTVTPQTLPSDWGMGICTPNGCLPGILEDTFTIAPAVTADLWIEFYTYNKIGFGTADLLLVNMADSTDLFQANLVADITSIGIDDHDNKAALFYNYPNPFHTTTNIKYHLPSGQGYMLITNVLGEPLRKYALDDRSGMIQLDITLAPGAYFYSLWQEGKRVAQQKMVVIK